ncbi:hypothetical protein BLNAU_1083 [Blattamonas nauphoetae]|uniref:Uncharacterized protein n=1 Tax=Blattamonas nauphoetae TaxID=2049346 RepID=A0ABQ9YJT5_9EUKA|nr:hypothetical protein BLNAU_1083 [Blattamonas nauphoetae]
MGLLRCLLIYHCYAQIQLALVKADLLPQIITILNPQSLSFTEAVDIHFNLLEIIALSLNLATPYPLSQLRIDDRDDQQAVHETIFQQVLVPSEKYMWHLCVHRFSIIDGMQSSEFMTILAVLIQISPYYHPTMDLVLHLPIYLTLPSCLTFFETCHSIYPVLSSMGNAQWEWNKKGGEVRQIGKKIHRMLRMEGIEDVIEDKLQNDINAYCGRIVIAFSIQWNNLLGITIPQEE